MIKQHIEQSEESEPIGTCDCGFSADECGANPCMRKKVHLAGLTPESKWPNTGTTRQPAGLAQGSREAFDDQVGWIIEKDDPPVYHLITADYDEHWTSDADKALRFARKEDAEAYIDHVGWTSPPVRTAEHMWVAPRVVRVSIDKMPRGGMEFDWQEWSLIYRKRLKALTKLICREGYAVASDGDGMPYELEPSPSRTPAETDAKVWRDQAIKNQKEVEQACAIIADLRAAKESHFNEVVRLTNELKEAKEEAIVLREARDLAVQNLNYWQEEAERRLALVESSAARPREFLAWAVEMFGPVAKVRGERLMRFIEEAVELAHADNMELETLHAIIRRVYSRQPGVIEKEIGQAQACLETYAENFGVSSAELAQKEWLRVQQIPRDEWERRHTAKQAIGIAMQDSSTVLNTGEGK